MIVTGLDGREYKLKLNKDIRKKVSQYHQRARELLREIFKFDTICEEVNLKVTRTKNLFADFLVVEPRLVVEIDGQAHSEYTPFFHENKQDFVAGQVRDKTKEQWAELNEFCFVRLPYNENIDQWRARVENRHG